MIMWIKTVLSLKQKACQSARWETVASGQPAVTGAGGYESKLTQSSELVSFEQEG